MFIDRNKIHDHRRVTIDVQHEKLETESTSQKPAPQVCWCTFAHTHTHTHTQSQCSPIPSVKFNTQTKGKSIRIHTEHTNCIILTKTDLYKQVRIGFMK